MEITIVKGKRWLADWQMKRKMMFEESVWAFIFAPEVDCLLPFQKQNNKCVKFWIGTGCAIWWIAECRRCEELGRSSPMRWFIYCISRCHIVTTLYRVGCCTILSQSYKPHLFTKEKTLLARVHSQTLHWSWIISVPFILCTCVRVCLWTVNPPTLIALMCVSFDVARFPAVGCLLDAIRQTPPSLKRHATD